MSEEFNLFTELETELVSPEVTVPPVCPVPPSPPFPLEAPPLLPPEEGVGGVFWATLLPGLSPAVLVFCGGGVEAVLPPELAEAPVAVLGSVRLNGSRGITGRETLVMVVGVKIETPGTESANAVVGSVIRRAEKAAIAEMTLIALV